MRIEGHEGEADTNTDGFSEPAGNRFFCCRYEAMELMLE